MLRYSPECFIQIIQPFELMRKLLSVRQSLLLELVI